MTLEEAREMEELEAVDVLAEIRSRHHPLLHGTEPCPVGVCCSCKATGCEVGAMIHFYDQLREQFIRHRTATHKVKPDHCETCRESDRILEIGG